MQACAASVCKVSEQTPEPRRAQAPEGATTSDISHTIADSRCLRARLEISARERISDLERSDKTNGPSSCHSPQLWRCQRRDVRISGRPGRASFILSPVLYRGRWDAGLFIRDCGLIGAKFASNIPGCPALASLPGRTLFARRLKKSNSTHYRTLLLQLNLPNFI